MIWVVFGCSMFAYCARPASADVCSQRFAINQLSGHGMSALSFIVEP